jgi:hypothetical protein
MENIVHETAELCCDNIGEIFCKLDSLEEMKKLARVSPTHMWIYKTYPNVIQRRRFLKESCDIPFMEMTKKNLEKSKEKLVCDTMRNVGKCLKNFIEKNPFKTKFQYDMKSYYVLNKVKQRLENLGYTVLQENKKLTITFANPTIEYGTTI